MVRKLLWLLFIFGVAACSNDGESNPERQNRILDSQKIDSSAKVLIIGFDGATWDMFDPALSQGKMPRLKALLETGFKAPLETMKPTITPIIWTTIATGKLPREHGVQSVVDRDPETGAMKPLTSQSVKVKTIWEILSERGKDVTVVRWPVTWPAKEVNGELVTDFAFQTARTDRVWPETLTSLVNTRQNHSRLKDIYSLTAVDEIRYNRLDPLWQWKLLVLLREYVLDVQFKDIARTLFEQNQRSFTAVYFYSLDALGHNYYRFLENSDGAEDLDFHDLVMNWCWLYDQFLAEILSSVDPDTHVIICSDHGMEIALKPQNFLIVSEDSPPEPNKPLKEEKIKPAPPFSADPFKVKLQYTAPSGQHVNKPDGIFVCSGPHVKQNKNASPLKITEIAPTVLYLLGQPVATDFANEPRLDLFTDEFVKNNPVKTVKTYETGANPNNLLNVSEYGKEDDLLLNRLEALGYIK